MIKNFLRLCLTLYFGLAGVSYAQQVFHVESVARLANLHPGDVAAAMGRAVVHVLSYSTNNPGVGGGEFFFNYAPIVTTNSLTGIHIRYTGNTNLGAWERVEKRPVQPQWWGVSGVSSNVPTVAISDNFQKAVNYAEETGINHVFNKHVGGFLLDKPVYYTSTVIEGVKPQMTYVSWPYEATTYVTATNFNPGPYYGAFVLTTPTVNKQSATPTLKNFTIVGHKAWTQRDPKVITAVSNRFSLFVATNDLPVAPPNPTVWPYYGHCFFYTSGDTHPAPYHPSYIGHAVVSNVNYTTGEILLDEEYGSPYATITNANFLTPGMTIVFSPIVVESARLIGNYTNVSPASAGIAGVALVGTNIDTLQRSAYLVNLGIENFHTGIREGLGIHTTIDGVFVGGHAFAGIAGTHSFGHRDSHYKGDNYLSGFQRADWYTLHPTNMVDWSYARSAYGQYDLSAASYTGQTVVDGAVTGFYFQRSANIMADLFRVDQPIADAFHFGGTSAAGSDDPNQADVVISRASALTIQSVYWPQTWRKTRNFIWSKPRTGYRNNVAIQYAHEGDFTSVGGASKDFDYTFNIASGDKIQVIAGGLAAHSNSLAPNSERPILGSEGGFTEPIGTHWYRDVATGGINLSVAGTNRVRFNAGGRVLDTVGNIWRAGADSDTGITRTDEANKTWWVEVPGYRDGDTNFVMAIAAQSTATGDTVYVGETGGGLRAPMTSWVGYGTDVKNGEFRRWWAATQSEWLTIQSYFMTNSNPYLRMRHMDAAADMGTWGIRVTTNGFFVTTWNDALSSGNNPIAIVRNSASPMNAQIIQLRAGTRGLHVQDVSGSENTNHLGFGPVLDDQERFLYRHDSGLVYLPPLDLSSITNGGGGSGGSGTNGLSVFGWAAIDIINVGGTDMELDTTNAIYSGAITNIYAGDFWESSEPTPNITVEFSGPRADTNYWVVVNSYAVSGEWFSIPFYTEQTETNFSFRISDQHNSALSGTARLRIVVFDASGGGGSGITDGDKGDITVSGATWTIDSSAVTSNKIAAGAINISKITGSGDTNQFLRGDGVWTNTPAVGGLITSVTTDFAAPGGELALTNTTGTGAIVRESYSQNASNITTGHLIPTIFQTNSVPMESLEGSANGIWGYVNGAFGLITLSGNEYGSWSDYGTDGSAEYTPDLDNIFVLDRDTNTVTGVLNAEGGIITPSFQVDALSGETANFTNVYVNGVNLTELLAAAGTKRIYLTAMNAEAPSSDYGSLIDRGATPNLLLSYTHVADSCTYWNIEIPPNWTGITNGLDVTVVTYTTSVTSGTNVFEVAFDAKGGEDVDVDSFDTGANFISAAAGTSGIGTVTTVTMTDLDDMVPGEHVKVAGCRLPGDSFDTINEPIQTQYIAISPAEP